MVCRSHPLGSVAIGLTKRDVDLDDAQLQSLVHQLRHEGASIGFEHRAPLQDSLRARLQHELDTDPTIKPQRRDGLQSRLDTCMDQALEPALAWALHHLRSAAARAQTNLRMTLTTLAAARGQSINEALIDFHALRTEAPSGRRRRADWDDRANAWGLPQDPSTRYAFDRLRREQPPRPPQRLITDHTHPVTGHPGTSFGYDAESGRLEIRAHDGTIAAYRNVPASIADSLRSPGNVGAALALTTLAARPIHHYPDSTSASASGWALRCDTCGRYAAQTHQCPGAEPILAIGEVIQYTTHTGDATLRTIAAHDLHQVLAAGRPVELPIRATCAGQPAATPDQRGLLAEVDHSTSHGTVDGTTIITAGDPPKLDLSGAQCTCPAYREHRWCRHLRITHDLVQDHLNRAAETSIPETASTAAVGSTRSTALVAAATATTLSAHEPLPPDVSTFSYSDDPLRFAADCRAALARTDEHGGVPYLDGSEAMYGYGAQRRFGVEIEYTAPPEVAALGQRPGDETPGFELTEIPDDHFSTNRSGDRGWRTRYREAYVDALGNEPSPSTVLNARIGADLHAHGLTSTPVVGEYASAKAAGYRSPHWSLETDATVAGELVSPILNDTPATWTELHQACRVITAHAASPDDAGAHVHVSAADYAGNPDRMTSLVRLLRIHEDDLYRLAGNPATPERISHWCRPVGAPPALGFARVVEAKRVGSAGSMVNLSELDTANPETSHLEFRLFDASLQPGRIQAQVKLAVALTDYAARTEIDPHTPRRPLGLGAADAAARGRGVTERFEPSHTAGIRQLIDQLFRRDIDKQQIAALWAVSVYQRPPRTETS